MAKQSKFHFNPETLSFERIETNFRTTAKKIVLHTFSSTFMGFVIFLIFSFFVDSPEEKQLRRDNKTLELEYELLSQRVDNMTKVLANLEQRDDNFYRVIFQAEPISSTVRHNSLVDNQRLKSISNMSSSALLGKTSALINQMERSLYVQSRSYDEIAELIKTNATKLKHIPAIQPILNKDLKRLASGFGYRVDPVYRVKRMHTGMDFTATIGTDVYATGDGRVSYVGWKQGYGNTVVIDHGFGYETLYAHLKKPLVRQGAKVQRADIIGLVGNTGKSTGPHLHYEVIYQGKHVDPLNYYFIDLSPEEYDRMIQLAANAGQVLD